MLVKEREWKQAEADRKALAAQREALQDEARTAVGKGFFCMSSYSLIC